MIITSDGKRLTIPHARIRRVVGELPARSSIADVRAAIKLRCDPVVWPQELVVEAEEYAVRVFRRMKEVSA